LLADLANRRLFIDESMKLTDTQELLADYVKHGSEKAFRELVTRYLDLVYSTALRCVGGDRHSAEDVCQNVFSDLARLASKLSKDIMLGGWLHRHTCYLASTFMRGERRREARERWAVEMNAINDSTDSGLAQLAPILDAAINELDDTDRRAILLRFYERMDLRAVGEALGSSENAAQKRVSRALDQLHSILTHRGVCLSVTALAAALTGEAVTAAPAALATSIVAGAMTGAATGAGVSVTLVKLGALAHLKPWFIAAFALTLFVTTLLLQHQSRPTLLEVNQRLALQSAEQSLAPSTSETSADSHPLGRKPVRPRPRAVAQRGDNTSSVLAISPVVLSANSSNQPTAVVPPVLLGNVDGQRIRFYSTSGGKLRIEGTTAVADWQVEGTLIGGFLEVDAEFPNERGQRARLGAYDAFADVFVMVRSLKSVDTTGHPYSDRMDEVMYQLLRSAQNPKIFFHLTEFLLKETAKDRESPYLFETKGNLDIAGVTNQIAFPATVLPLTRKKLKISGSLKVKLTDFGIEPPSIGLSSDVIRVGDEVKVTFDWMLAQRDSSSATSTKH
jgi:RNA polymerase sigma factor (sigma-70 family)